MPEADVIRAYTPFRSSEDHSRLPHHQDHREIVLQEEATIQDITRKSLALDPYDRFRMGQIINRVKNYSGEDKNVIKPFFLREIDACLNTYYAHVTHGIAENRSFQVRMDTLKRFAQERLGMPPKRLYSPLSPMSETTVSEFPPTPNRVMPTWHHPRTP